MPRLNVVEPEQATGKTKELYDGIVANIGKVLTIFKGMGNSPAALNAYLSLGGALQEGELTGAEQETIALTISQANDCRYCQAAHTAIAAGFGIDGDEAVRIRKGEATDSKIRALSEFVLAVQKTTGYATDAQLAAVRAAGYSDGAIAEAVAVIAQTTFTNFFNHVNETEIDFPVVPVI